MNTPQISTSESQESFVVAINPTEKLDVPIRSAYTIKSWLSSAWFRLPNGKHKINSMAATQIVGFIYLIVYVYVMLASWNFLGGIVSSLLVAAVIYSLSKCRVYLQFSEDGVRRVVYSKSSKKLLSFRIFEEVSNFANPIKPWSDLRSVRFAAKDRLPMGAGGVILDRADSMVLDWEVTKSILRLQFNVHYLNLEGITDEQREKLFLMISRYAPQEILSPEILFLQVQTLCGSDEAELNGCTQIWLEEFNRRFEISNYVTLPPGAVCGNGRYIINMTIGTKINTSTYLAAEKPGLKVVIKELVTPADNNDAVQKKQMEQFLREASILAKLNHPSIVKVRDYFVENGRSYLVMDCAPGKNMRELVHLGGVIDEAMALDVAADLISVLQYLHGQDQPILHRDLTPDNLVFVEHSKSVMVIDFGAANVFTTGKTQTLVGKQFYMPPEQFKGQPSPASDIYSFGATMCFLVSGRDMVSMAKLPPLEELGVSPEMIQLIDVCTRFDAHDRPSADQLAERIANLKTTSKALRDLCYLICSKNCHKLQNRKHPYLKRDD